MEAIWDKFTADEEFYRINTNDFKVGYTVFLPYNVFEWTWTKVTVLHCTCAKLSLGISDSIQQNSTEFYYEA